MFQGLLTGYDGRVVGRLKRTVAWRRVNEGRPVGPGHEKDLVCPRGQGDVDDTKDGPDGKKVYRRDFNVLEEGVPKGQKERVREKEVSGVVVDSVIHVINK